MLKYIYCYITVYRIYKFFTENRNINVFVITNHFLLELYTSNISLILFFSAELPELLYTSAIN